MTFPPDPDSPNSRGPRQGGRGRPAGFGIPRDAWGRPLDIASPYWGSLTPEALLAQCAPAGNPSDPRGES